jgi:hypothetical protein
MSSTRTLSALAVGLAALGGGLYAFLELGQREGTGRPAAPEARGAPRTVAQPAEELIPLPRVERYDAAELAATTVLWPLRVELDLVEAAYLPSEEGMPPIGSGASARLTGKVLGPDDAGARAEITFVAGPNTGRVLASDSTGSFGASDLFPGLSIVEIRGKGLLGSRREVRLRQGKETLLNVPYGSPGTVQGRVQDRDGEPIEYARVRVDGSPYTTGPEGTFVALQVAPGQVLVEVEHEDYTGYQELVWVGAGRLATTRELVFTLMPSATLEVAVLNNLGGPGPVQLFLLPGLENQRPHAESAYRNSRFPFHRLNPVEVWPGRPHAITGLPAQGIQVHAFRPGAKTSMKFVNLRSDRPYQLQIQLEPAPMLTGRVLDEEGEPAVGADVRLQAPNRVRATLGYLRQGNHYLETAVMPIFPPAQQEVITGDDGRFVLTAWEDESPTRYVEARGADGKTWAGTLVRRGEESIELKLAELDVGRAELVLALPGRFQGLPIELLLDGSPVDPWILPPSEDLRVHDLLAGRWRMKVSWHGAPVAEESALELGGETQLRIELPPECIEGQDEEAWRRAGREYPGSP